MYKDLVVSEVFFIFAEIRIFIVGLKVLRWKRIRITIWILRFPSDRMPDGSTGCVKPWQWKMFL